MELLDLDDIFDNDRIPVPRGPDVRPDDLPPEWQEFYESRVVIGETSGLPRELAEHYALRSTLNVMRTWHLYPTY